MNGTPVALTFIVEGNDSRLPGGEQLHRTAECGRHAFDRRAKRVELRL